MSFERKSGIRSEVYLRTDLANILTSLEPKNARSGFEQGWLEALCRVGLAVGLQYVAPEHTQPARSPAPAYRAALPVPGSRPNSTFEGLLLGLGEEGLAAFREVLDAVAQVPASQRDAVIDSYLRRLDAGTWPGW